MHPLLRSFTMLADSTPIFLLASPEPALLAVIEPVLAASGARVEIVLSAQAALAAMTAPNPPTLTLLDVNLSDMEMGQLLAVVRAQVSSKRLPIVLISDTVTQEWINRLAEGVIDDLILRAAESPYWRLRLDMVMRTLHRTRELESLRETAVLNAQTDRVQRMKSSLCLILFDIDDFGHWNSRLGADACDDLLCQVVSRTARLLRSYDLLGRPGMDEFLVALPGCIPANAVMLAERVRLEVFSSPFRVAGDSIRLSACFGIASSQGRSPVVVLRDAEQALQSAKAAGPESIHCFDDSQYSSAAPVTFLLPSSGDELLAW